MRWWIGRRAIQDSCLLRALLPQYRRKKKVWPTRLTNHVTPPRSKLFPSTSCVRQASRAGQIPLEYTLYAFFQYLKPSNRPQAPGHDNNGGGLSPSHSPRHDYRSRTNIELIIRWEKRPTNRPFVPWLLVSPLHLVLANKKIKKNSSTSRHIEYTWAYIMFSEKGDGENRY